MPSPYQPTDHESPHTDPKNRVESKTKIAKIRKVNRRRANNVTSKSSKFNNRRK